MGAVPRGYVGDAWKTPRGAIALPTKRAASLAESVGARKQAVEYGGREMRAPV